MLREQMAVVRQKVAFAARKGYARDVALDPGM